MMCCAWDSDWNVAAGYCNSLQIGLLYRASSFVWLHEGGVIQAPVDVIYKAA